MDFILDTLRSALKTRAILQKRKQIHDFEHILPLRQRECSSLLHPVPPRGACAAVLRGRQSLRPCTIPSLVGLAPERQLLIVFTRERKGQGANVYVIDRAGGRARGQETGRLDDIPESTSDADLRPQKAFQLLGLRATGTLIGPETMRVLSPRASTKGDAATPRPLPRALP